MHVQTPRRVVQCKACYYYPRLSIPRTVAACASSVGPVPGAGAGVGAVTALVLTASLALEASFVWLVKGAKKVWVRAAGTAPGPGAVVAAKAPK